MIVSSTWTHDGNYCVSIDPTNWGGKIKSNSQRIPVYIDGVKKSDALLQISSALDGDGYQYIYVNLGGYEISGSTVSFTIPEGFLVNKSGTIYNYACKVSM